MKTQVRCACGASYNIDVDKYGGKKIRCKACQAVLDVPTADSLKDDFEVVEDAPQAGPASAPADAGAERVLMRNRLASKSAAVNIALLQRSEPSKGDIRRAFLTLHGDKSEREASILQAEQEVARQEQDLQRMKAQLPRFVETLAKARATRPTLNTADLLFEKGLGVLRQLGRLSNKTQTGEDVYEEAIHVNGGPVPAERSVFAQTKKDREAKMATIEAAIIKLRERIAQAEQQLSTSRRAAEASRSKWLSDSRAALEQASGLIVNGDVGQAQAVLEPLLKTTPLEILGHHLALLSKCSFLAGNLGQAARHMQDAVCFGASAPTDMEPSYNDLWAKACAGLPKT